MTQKYFDMIERKTANYDALLAQAVEAPQATAQKPQSGCDRVSEAVVQLGKDIADVPRSTAVASVPARPRGTSAVRTGDRRHRTRSPAVRATAAAKPKPKPKS